VNYSYLHFSYPGILGSTGAHGVAGSYSIRLSRTLEFSGYAGAYRIESLFAQQTPVDPAIAALLGITTVQQIVYRINYTPQLSARLARVYRTGVFFIGGGQSVNPGNGVFVTSTAVSILSGYSYTGLRRWSFGVSGGYTTANSLGTVNGKYNDSQQGMQISREISRSVHFVASFSARQYRSPDYQNYTRNLTDVRIGIGYSPGEIPIRIW
jgi:hypothetical protein